MAMAGNVSLSGKVTDKAGHGIAGIWVGLETTQIATLTGSDGSWSLNGSTGIASRPTRERPLTRHLVREGGRLRVSFEGTDASGRNLSSIGEIGSASGTHAAARTFEADFDTLLYVHGTTLLAATPISTSSFQLGDAVLDTSWVQSYSKNGDTLLSIDVPYVNVYCSSQKLSVWRSPPDTSNDLIRMTPDGFELVRFGPASSLNPYPIAAKFRRLSGNLGSVVGRFQFLGAVCRPTIANVPDSTKKIISEDSAMFERSLANVSFVYAFTETTISIVSRNTPNFAQQFLNNWSYVDESGYYYYSAYDSTWTDERRSSDSANYDIAVQLVDSSTVQLTGAKTGEIVSIHAATAANGFDRTYSSSIIANATGTRLAKPTSCPEAASWYESFRSANYHTASLPGAARKANLTFEAPKPVRHHLFF
jgi:hypothetical protein